MDLSAVTRSAHLDASAFNRSKTFEFFRYFTRLHYHNLQILSLRCSNDFSAESRTANRLINYVARVRDALMPGLETLILHGGRVTLNNLDQVAAMERPPRILLRNVVICELPVVPQISISLHVQIKERTIDFAKMPWKDTYEEYSDSGDSSDPDSGDSSDTFALHPMDAAVREMMLEVLRFIPVKVEDEEIALKRVAKITAKKWGVWSRKCFVQSLKL